MGLCKNKKYFLAVLLSAFSVMVISPNAFADSLSSAVNKMNAYRARQCYNSSEANSTITASYYESTRGGWDAIFVPGDASYWSVPTSGGNSATYKSCNSLMKGVYGGKAPAYSSGMSESSLTSTMSKLGYEKNGDSYASSETFTVPFDNGQSMTIKCENLGSGGVINGGTVCSASGISQMTVKFSGSKVTLTTCATTECTGSNKVTKTQKITSGSTTAASAIEGLFGQITDQTYYAKGSSDGIMFSSSSKINSSGTSSSYEYKQITTSGRGKTLGVTSFQEYVSGYSGGASALTLTSQEQEDLAWGYLTKYYNLKYYGGKENCGSLTNDQKQKALDDGYRAISLGAGKVCYVQAGANANAYVMGWNNDGTPGKETNFNELLSLFEASVKDEAMDGAEECKTKAENRKKSFQYELDRGDTSISDERKASLKSAIAEIDNMLNSNKYYTKNDSGGIDCAPLPDGKGGTTSGETTYNPNDRDDAVNNAVDDESVSNVQDQDKCFDEAGVLGWILCPVLRIAGNAVDAIYSNIEDDYLAVKSSMLDGATTGWGSFRGFANTLFAALFVIVILSQITGIGLSNYNIKKILPRLIAVVVLVNLSFILCQVAVDLSNILGVGLKQMFTEWGKGLGMNAEVDMDFGAQIVSLVTSIGGGAAILGVGISVATGSWFSILIPLLVLVVTSLIGVFFFFVILGVRQAGIVILIVLSPVAIACYALPNTQGVFKKWWKLFLDLLLVYPICGALMGGGDFVSKLLLSGKTEVSAMYGFVVLLLQVVPFFFIPTILRSAVNGIGGLGNKIQGLSRRGSMMAGMGIRRSNWAREHMEEAQRNASSFRNKIQSGVSDKLLKSKLPLTGRQRRSLNRRLVRSNAVLEKLHEEDTRNKFSAANGAYRPGSIEYERNESRIDREAFAHSVEGQIAQFKNDDDFDNQSVEKMLGAHDSYVNEVMTAKQEGRSSREAEIKARAVEQMLMKMSPDDGAAGIANNYMKLMQTRAGTDAVTSTALSDSIGRFVDENGKEIKDAVGKADLQTLSTYASGKTADINAVSAEIASYRDNKGNERFYNSKYINNDAKKMTGRTLENYSDSHIDDLKDAIINGHLDKEGVQQTLSAIQEYNSNPNINKKNSKKVDELYRTALSHGAVANSSVKNASQNAGSHALSTMSSAGLNDIAKRIQSGDISGTEASRIVSNLELAGQDDGVAHSKEWIDAANNVMKTANSNGVMQLEGANGQYTVGSSAVGTEVEVTNVKSDRQKEALPTIPRDIVQVTEAMKQKADNAERQAKYGDTIVEASTADYNAAVATAMQQFPPATRRATASDIQKMAIMQGLDDPGKVKIKVGQVINEDTSGNIFASSQDVADRFAQFEKDGVGFKPGDKVKVSTSGGVTTHTALTQDELNEYMNTTSNVVVGQYAKQNQWSGKLTMLDNADQRYYTRLAQEHADNAYQERKNTEYENQQQQQQNNP